MGGSIFAKLWILLFPYAPRKEISTYIWLKCMVNVGIPYMEHMGFDFLVIFYKMFEGIDHHDTLPEKKKRPRRLMVGRRYFSFFWGRLFFRGKLAVFKEWRFETSLHLTGKSTWSPKKPSKSSPAKFDRKNFGDEETVGRKLLARKRAHCSTGLWFWPRKIMLMGVSNLVKKSGMKYQQEKTVWRLGHCLRHLSQMPQVS